MRYAIAMFTAAAAMFVAIGANAVLEQQRALTAARPVPGTVVESRVIESSATDPKNRKTTAFRPFVRYRFQVGDTIFGSSQVFPPPAADTSRKRAEQIVADHPVGKNVIVWISPMKSGNGETSFLLREWDFTPYLSILCGMIFLAVGLGFWAAAPWRTRQLMPPKALRDGGYELAVGATLAARRRPWRAVALIWFVLGGVTVWHYFTNADRPYETIAWVATPIYFALGLIPVAMYLRHLRAARVMRDARVFTNAESFRVGKTVDVRVEQAFRKAVRVEGVRLGLLCEAFERATVKGKKSTVRKTRVEDWQDLKADAEASPAAPLKARGKVTPPADQPPSTPEKQSDLPRFAWRIVLEVRVSGRPPYRAEYPIVVGP